uniref:non-specific serine/threonine protein kinase n=1 Tax=Cymbidium ensifolium TaxID=78740 RepID=A0A5C1YVE2_CYMEN|nr:putative L-type lectin-domain containing receptor kinase IV.1-like isoform X1 [Cymbidium ensifolium]
MDWVKEGRRRIKYPIFSRFLASFLLLTTQINDAVVSSSESGFVFNGFDGAALRLNGGGAIESNGLLQLTNFTKNEVGHAFCPTPFVFVNSSSGEPFSFSTSFVFAIFPQYEDISSHGIAFAIAPSTNLTAVLPSQHLGLFNFTNNGDPSNHIVAVELDTIQNREFDDINDNHVGIDVNSLISTSSAPASFFLDSSGLQYENLSLISGEPMRVWAEYDGKTMVLNVTLAPLFHPKPERPLLSSKLNLSSIVLDNMYVGFAASTGAAAGSHYILGWSFSMNGKATELDLSQLPSLPPRETEDTDTGKKTQLWIILLPTVIFILLLIASFGIVHLVKTKKKFAEEMEDWETEYGPHRFSYKELYRATKGFRDENLLGNGGFGGVYKGQLPKSKLEIAVKRISHDSRQGMKEFVAEIASIGRLRHRNLVQLLGYCRRRGELLLVYDYMPNSSLEKYIFDRPQKSLNWSQRFKIIRGIASGLLYLHEEWEQVVIHRDIKASNVLLDAEFNGKLGDFGLARLHDRGSNLQTTRVVGTLGYLAPELSRSGKSTTCSDVFGFGAFLLEVACGKRPIELKISGIETVLVDWVMECLKKGDILEARDRKLGTDFSAEELEMVLRLGLMCSHPSPAARPCMRQVVKCFEGEVPLPEISEEDFYVFDSSSRRNRVLVGGSSQNSCTAPTNLSSSFSDSPLSRRN